jgi:hypothetical protein
MDMSLVSAILGAQAGAAQATLAAKFMRENADAGSAIAQMLDAATQNTNTLANVAAGTGTNLNISA